MNYNIGINGSGFKFKHQLISNIGTTQVNADLKNGNYIQASINTAGNYGNLHITNTTNRRFGNLFVVEHIQAYTGSTYKPLILSGYIRSGYNTIGKPGKSIGLLAGESVMLLQQTDTLYQPYFTAVGYNMNNLIPTIREIPFNQQWYNIGISGTTCTYNYDDMTGISAWNIFLETTGLNAEIWYPCYLTSDVNYKIYIDAKKGSNRGKISVYIGPNLVNATPVDLYAAAPAWDTLDITSAGYFVPGYTGNHIIRIVAIGKHASSTAYNLVLSHIRIVPQINTYV